MSAKHTPDLAVAEWQASANGGKSWRRIDADGTGMTLQERVEYLRNYKGSRGQPAYMVRSLVDGAVAAQQHDALLAVSLAPNFRWLDDATQDAVRAAIAAATGAAA